MNILLIGPTGVGKSTLARNIVGHCNSVNRATIWDCVISGDIVRSFASDDDKDGFSRGKLYSDERFLRWQLLNHINKLSYHGGIINIVLDGFPRTEDQLHFMLLAHIPIHLALWIEVPFEEVVERIKKRQRDEIDTVETAMNRTINEKAELIKLWSHLGLCGVYKEWINASDMGEKELLDTVVSIIDKRIKDV